MKILRVSITYPYRSMPGVGLPCYYHSLFSHDKNMIITAQVNDELIQNKEDNIIVQIPLKNISLGRIIDNKLKKTYKILNKIICQLKFLIKALKYINKFKPDIVHIYSPIPLFFGLYCKYKYNSIFVMSLHGTDVERINGSYLLSKILIIPDKIVVVSNSMIDKINKYKTKKSIECIGNGVDLSIFKNEYKQRQKQFIQVSNLRWQKGQDCLLKAFAYFINDFPNYRLIIIGDGEDKNKLIKLTDKLGITNKVVFNGVKDRAFIVNELNLSQAFILSSVIEGFPKVVIESMATGTPVISTDVGNVREVIKDSGIIVKVNDVFELYNAMKKISLTKEWMVFSRKSQNYSANYTWENVANKLSQIYNYLLDEKIRLG